jgi:hypothetical protein
MVSEEQSIPICQLKKYEPTPWPLRDHIPDPPPQTASEWFSKKWPKQAGEFGTPFLEAKYSSIEGQRVNPIAMNEIFFASILAGDENLGHKIVHYTPEDRFYFKDPRDEDKFRPTSEDKLKTLLSLYLLQCAEELKDSTPKFNLFVRFRKDQELQAVINKARSLLAVDKSFFDAESPNIRIEGVEVCGRAAKTFIHVLVEVNPAKTMTVTDSYTAFQEFCVKNGMMLVERSLFENLAVEIIKKEFGLGLRHDIPNALGRQQRGWRGVGLKEGDRDLAALMAN